ncbi:hypothetical protein D4764_04G0013180 [Takifugu flavidus]|uniref:Uncharacterized protein n=1 Tax=Takifugu flavidus TaxID=433684 RepID=A0A5C6N8Q2_9TELE|nr:hypothetical protein D4764_04G0013180 [Takifugu flavidus]
MVVGGGSGDLSRLTRRHGVKVGARSLYTVEEVALAVGEVIGHGSVKSAARMNGAVVLFVKKVEQVNLLVGAGISDGRRFDAVLPLTQPAAYVTLSNVHPLITNEFLCRELSSHGKIVSPMRKVMSGSKSAASGSGERPGAATAEPCMVEPRAAEPGAAAEQPVAGAEGPGVDGVTAPVGTDSSTGEGEQRGEAGLQVAEVGEEEELGCGGAAGAVELMEQETGWSPAPSRLCRSNRPGPVKAKKSRQTGRQTGGKLGEPDNSDSEGCVSDDGGDGDELGSSAVPRGYRPVLPSIIMRKVRSLPNKMDELAALTWHQWEYRKCSLLLFTETRLTVLILDTAAQLDGFTLLWADRSKESGKRKGGGLAVL